MYHRVHMKTFLEPYIHQSFSKNQVQNLQFTHILFRKTGIPKSPANEFFFPTFLSHWLFSQLPKKSLLLTHPNTSMTRCPGVQKFLQSQTQGQLLIM